MALPPFAEAQGQGLRAVLDAAHEAFVSVDSRGLITDWNPAAQRIFGWSRDEVIGRPLGETIVPERLRDRFGEGYREYAERGEWALLGERVERIGRHRDGHEIPLEFSAVAVTLDGELSFHAFIRDISDRKRAERRFAAQHAVSSALAEAESAEEGLPGLLAGLGESLGWDFGAYWHPEEGALSVATVWRAKGLELDAFENVTRALTLAPGVGLAGRVWRSGEPAWVEDVREHPAFPQGRAAAEAGLRTAICLPIASGPRARGVIEFLARDPQQRSDELLDLMSALTWQIGRYFTVLDERAAAVAKLESLALTDELTGLANRRAWDAGIERELARARRDGSELCVALLDLDGFKDFNDRHGHQEGDELLFETARAWQATVRTTDLLARYGGEEFALAFPASGPADLADQASLLVVERLRDAVPRGQTCSAGLVTWDGSEAAAEVVGRADKALYEAKRAGRDRTVRL